MSERADALVLGSEPNALVAAAYLARAGLKVTVLEPGASLGGPVATEDLAPGFKADTGPHLLPWAPKRILQDLRVRQAGLELLAADPTLTVLDGRGGHLTFWRDVGRTVEALRALSPADAERWPAFVEHLARLARFVALMESAPPPKVPRPEVAEAAELARLGWRLWRYGRAETMEALRALPMPARTFIEEWFETPLLQAALAACGLGASSRGPYAPGTTYALLRAHTGLPAVGVGGGWAVRGGMGAWTAALAEAGRRLGVQVRLEAPVRRVLLEAGRVAGVALESGEEVPARLVLSALDVRRTFLDLVGAENLDPSFLRRVRAVRFRGVEARLNLALRGTPRLEGLPEDGPHLRGRILIADSLLALERAFDAAKHGHEADEPVLEVRFPSALDPDLAPAGAQVASVRVFAAPYHRQGGWDQAAREALVARVMARLEHVAPGIQRLVEAVQVFSPADYEARFGLAEGSLEGGELTLDQFWFMRPMPGWARYATPVRGLYLTGAGTHPGGFSGWAGYHAARRVLAGRGR